MANKYSVLRIDPIRQHIGKMTVMLPNDATRELKRITRAKKIGWRELVKIGETTLLAIAGVELEMETPGWRIRGGEDTTGISILIGKVPMGGMVLTNCPVDLAWAHERIQWVAGEDLVGLEARAQETLPILDEPMRAAVRGAMPSLADGEMWLTLEHKEMWGPAVALGIGAPGSDGQRLTPLGFRLHEMLLEEIDHAL